MLHFGENNGRIDKPLAARLYAEAADRGIIHPAALYGLTSVLTDYDVPRRRAAKQATTALRSCSTLCMSEAICILRMRQGHPAHGHVH